MRRALFKLMRLQLKGWLRRQFSGGSARRLVFGVLGTIMFLIWLSSVAVGSAFQKSSTPEDILATLPLYIMAFALLPIIVGSDDRAITFTPAEVDILFPGPFSRRDLVLYRLFKLLVSSVAAGLFFGLVMRRFASSLLASMAGAVLTFMFINTFTTAVAIVRDAVRDRLYTGLRAGAAAVLIMGAGGVMWLVSRSDLPIQEAIKKLGDSQAIRVALAPARVFAHVFAAQSLSEAWPWFMGCVAMIVGAVLTVLALDKGYMEAALGASQRRQTRLIAARMGGVVPSGKPAKALALPDLSALGPSGAIVKKQLITALRTSRGWMVLFALAVGYGYVVSRVMGDHGKSVGAAGLIPGLTMLVLVLPQMLRFDFRGDLDHLELIKALPISAVQTALAELAVPSAILTLLCWVIAGGVAGFVGLPAGTLVMAALAIPPACALVIALENFVFLILPSRLVMPGQAGAVFSGRRLLMTLARMGLILLGGGLIAVVGLCAWMAGHSILLTFSACWLVLIGITSAVIWVVTWAYARFDISVDLPT